jgi:LPS export ABC transporter protein LptC
MRWMRVSGLGVAVAVGVSLLLGGCGGQNQTAKKLAQDSQQVQDFDNSLTFSAVTLEDVNEKGQPWWKVKATQASYSKDKKVAKVEKPEGKFFQDGKEIVEVKAESGEIQQDGKTLFLRGKIKAKDLRDGLEMEGNELEWQPRKDLLILRNGLTGKHKQMKLAAKEAKYFSRARRMEASGQVKGETTATKTSPATQFSTEKMTWNITKEIVTCDQSLELKRFKDKVLTDQAKAQQGEVNLKTNAATLKQGAKVVMTQPAIDLASDHLLWQFDDQRVISEAPVTVLDRKEQLTLSADRGKMELDKNLVFLTGNVRGSGGSNQSQLRSGDLVWNLTSQQFEAMGEVFYQQGNPPITLAGPKATGQLKDSNIVVSGGDTGGRVTTEFIP